MASPPFRFKRFLIDQEGATHPVGTDGVLLGAWADCSGAGKILDIGTGTGIVALMLAQRTEKTPGVLISAVELDQDAFECARRNFAASPWAGRFSAIHQSIQEYAHKTTERYDLIVSNPPFFSETILSPDKKRQLGRAARSLSLQELLDVARSLLTPSGRLCVVLPPAEGRRLIEWGTLQGLYCTRETSVFARADKPCERLLLELQRNPYHMQRSEFYIYAREEEWSEDMRTLTRDFYLYF